MWLFALLVGVPIIEIALFVEIGGAIGLWPTLAIVVATALAGSLLLRSQGAATLNSLQQSVSQGKNPMTSIAHGALILGAGIFLLTPGFFTDAVGLTLLVPPVRRFLIRIGADKLAGRTVVFGQGAPQDQDKTTENPDIIDGDFSVDDKNGSPNTDSSWARRDR